MDQNHVVPDQLPDEKYIERLFPKCPPKQQHQQQQQGSYYGANDKRPTGLTRSSSARLGNSGIDGGAGASETGGTSGQKRRAKYKVQQHSRRELEARRNKNKEAASLKDNNININFNNNNNNGHSSDSSDGNSNITNNRGRSSLRRSGSSNLQRYGGGVGVNNSAAGNIQKIANPTNTSQAPSMSGQTQTRRTGKYAASQSLFTKQLQRSQSSYNTTSSSNGSQQVSNIEPVALKNATVESSNIVKLTTNSQAVSRGASGIVKSASSFAFRDEQQPSNSTIRTPTTTVAPSNKCQPQVSNLKMAHQDELIESGGGGPLHATNAANQITHLEAASKNDNSTSDLFDNSVDYNNSTDIAAASGRVRILRGSNSLSFGESSNSNINPLRQQQPTQIVERNAQELINDVPSAHRNERIKSNNNPTAKMFAEEKSEPMLVDVASAPVPAPAVSFPSSAIPHHQQQPIQTADLELHEKTGDSIIRRDPLATSTTAGLINIVGPSQQLAGHSNNNNTDKSNCLDNLNGNKTTSTNKQNSEVNVDLPPNRSKDDDKYINLFVYDNATNPLRTQQLETSLEGSRRKQQQPQQHQVFHSNKSTKNRPRGKRYPNRISDLNKENDESNLESQRDNIEITEIVEEEPHSSIVASTSTALEERLISSYHHKQTTLLPSPSSPVAANLGQFESENNSLDSQKAPNIISTHHQASQQLLATDFNDIIDDGIVRHDASTEELCNTSDSLDETKKCINQSRKNQDSDNLSLKRLDFNPTITNSNTSNTRSHRVPPTVAVLQTVDEKAEINSEELREEAEGDEEGERVDVGLDKINLELNSDAMPANQPSFTKKGFVPPGHPQRIRPQTTSTEMPSQLQSSISNSDEWISLTSDTLREVAKPIGILPEKALDLDIDPISIQDFRSIIKSHTKSENQRVKFDEANLASVRDIHGRLGQVQQNTLEGDKVHIQEADSSIIKRSNEPQMPIISEAQFESEFDAAKTIDLRDSDDRDLTVGMNKISISNSPQENFGDISYRNEPSSSEKHYQISCEKNLRNNSYVPETQQTQQQQLADIQQPYTSVDQSKSLGLETVARVPNLRHHKLPNESSHYSVVRAGSSGAVCSNSNNVDNNINVPSRSSSIQFNTLSDGESGADDDDSPGHSTAARGYPTQLTKKCDPSQQQQIGQANRNYMGTLKSSKNNGSGSGLNDDDMMPTTKTALIFPRLDEGLSSEAESCEDDMDDDDEKAMDADVDADDDDDNDNDIDDDLDNDNLSLDKGTLQLSQSTVDCFLRQQQQQSKPQNRLIGSPPQHGSPLIGIMADQSELHQVKAPGSAYGGYINQDPLDHNDLKSLSGYSNHNGQPSNYWMGVSSHQQPNMSSQPSSSQHFTQTRNQNNNNLISKNNNSFNREEAKTTNRLSSDTDNETDRLLGAQRTDQLKLTNNDVNSNASTDLQPVNVMKQNPNSREVLIEGVLFNVKYLGSTHSDCEGRSEKEDRIHQAEMAVHEVKFRNGDSQSAAEVQLFISTEKIMVLDDKNRKIMMDHSLRTISYIADIGDAIVLIVRKKNSNNDVTNELRPVSKISCHVFESSESHTITKSISQAFQVAYTELLKANGTGDTSSYLPKELDYQEVLNSQEMSTDELEMFARKENQREVIVPKEKGEILGLSIVESGWGSVLPTVVIANLKHDGPAYRCKKLSIGDQILSVDGISLVGLPMAECQEILRRTKKQSVARLSVVPCPITVEVKIKRPDTKYQLGFSVQNGVICSLLRGGIAERGGVRVGHRIMSINGTAVVGVPHEKIVTLLASSVGEIRMKTCLTSLYRLILGEEKAVHF